jgi:hypothetical protein
VTKTGEIEILGGLEKGEEVVIFGQDAIKENDWVNADWQDWTNRDLTAESAAH